MATNVLVTQERCEDRSVLFSVDETQSHNERLSTPSQISACCHLCNSGEQRIFFLQRPYLNERNANLLTDLPGLMFIRIPILGGSPDFLRWGKIGRILLRREAKSLATCLDNSFLRFADDWVHKADNNTEPKSLSPD
jgi:hypothetical protein